MSLRYRPRVEGALGRTNSSHIIDYRFLSYPVIEQSVQLIFKQNK